jgi:hypothetical protein
LDIGARDGHFSFLLAERFEEVYALDLEQPVLAHPTIRCLKGDVTRLEFNDKMFDLVFCTEVLEHIPKRSLEAACKELARITKQYLLIGVPYKQDIRVGKTTCCWCGNINPPWGHINVFDEIMLKGLFPSLHLAQVTYVETTQDITNSFTSFIMNLAGNPYGTYMQEEPCVFCGKKLVAPGTITIPQKILVKIGLLPQTIQRIFCKPHPQWVHILFKVPDPSPESISSPPVPKPIVLPPKNLRAPE